MNAVEVVKSTEETGAMPSPRLRLWLIVVTVIAGIAVLAAVPAAFLAVFMTAFAADDPTAPADSALNLLATFGAVGVGFYLLLIAGVVGGWIAYRKRRSSLSFGLSLMAAVPIVLVVVAVVAVVVLNIVWTASL